MARQPLSRVSLGLLLESFTTNRKSIQNEEKKMEKNLEVKIAYRIWNQLNQLESILWDRYRYEFLSLPIEKDDNDCSQDHSQNLDDLF
jgi:hypothetical protein